MLQTFWHVHEINVSTPVASNYPRCASLCHSREKRKTTSQISLLLIFAFFILQEYQVTKEGESAVLQNLKSKATTPPITLRNFFKVKQRESSDSDSDSASPKTETKTELQSEAVDQNSSCKSKFFSKSGSNPNIKNGKQTKTNGKRTSSGNSGFERNKRQKQSALKNSFQNNVKVKNATTSCPICRMEFESGTKNEDVNNHIDQCLIE